MVKNVDSSVVSHEGKVVEIKGTTVRVRIFSESACAGCHAKGVCGGANSVERIIDATYSQEEMTTDPIQKGDSVNVIMEEKLGWKAILYGFFLPFIVLLAVLFISNALGAGEAKGGIFALLSLIPYYLILWMIRKKIEKDFVFRVEKIKIKY